MNEDALKNSAREIFAAALRAVDPKEAVKRFLSLEGEILKVENREYDLRGYEGIYVVGGGKAGASMARGLEEVLGERIKAGVVVVKYGYVEDLKKVELRQAAHPIPDEAGLQSAQTVLDLLSERGEKDLVFCLISGGGSALLPLPAEGLTLQEKQQVTQLLLESGARIEEINALRKHLSRIKGGQLARCAHPATLIVLILSDVVGDPLEVISSGLTVPDRSTFSQCLDILERYGLLDRVLPAVRNHIREGVKGNREETPKEGDPFFQDVCNVVVGSNFQALWAAREQAEKLGFHPLILSSFVQGETREVAGIHAAIGREILSTGNPVVKPACVISGGETTVTIRGKGLGGRNQEFALAAAMEIDGLEGVVILSGGTDGTDGPTDAAGAVVDGRTCYRARRLGLDSAAYLAHNDSYHYFSFLGDLLVTGPTNTNVMDVRLILVA